MLTDGGFKFPLLCCPADNPLDLLTSIFFIRKISDTIICMVILAVRSVMFDNKDIDEII